MPRNLFITRIFRVYFPLERKNDSSSSAFSNLKYYFDRVNVTRDYFDAYNRTRTHVKINYYLSMRGVERREGKQTQGKGLKKLTLKRKNEGGRKKNVILENLTVESFLFFLRCLENCFNSFTFFHLLFRL